MAKYPNYIVICTFHHNIFETPYSIENRNRGESKKWRPPLKNQGLFLKNCFKYGIDLLLVGHSHVSSIHTLYSYEEDENTHPLNIISAGIFNEHGAHIIQPYLTVNHISYETNLVGDLDNIILTPYKYHFDNDVWDKLKIISLPYHT